MPAATTCRAQSWHGKVVVYSTPSLIETPRRAASSIAAISACIGLANSIKSISCESRRAPGFSLVPISTSRSLSIPSTIFEGLSNSAWRSFCRMSASNNRLSLSLVSYSSLKSLLSGVSPCQYWPPPAFGTSFVPTAIMSASSVVITAPTDELALRTEAPLLAHETSRIHRDLEYGKDSRNKSR